jgi:hypothetical protein
MATQNKFLRDNKVSKMSREDRNKWYNSLTKPQKAVAIAEDVLMQISNKKYEMSHGTYFQVTFSDDITQRTVNDILKKNNLDELVAARSVTCELCAMGGAFMSAVGLGNQTCSMDVLGYDDDTNSDKEYPDFEPGDNLEVDGSSKLHDKLKEAFTEREFRAMEFMFEGSDVVNIFDYHDRSYLTNYYNAYYDQHSQDATKQMRLICANIIKNKGYFLIPNVNLNNLDK